MSGPEFFSQHWYRRPISFHIELVHIGASILTSYIYPELFPVVLHLMWFAIDYTVIVSFLGSMQAK